MLNETPPEFSIRAHTDDDLGYIYKSWTKGLASSSPWKHIDRDLLVSGQRAHMDRCLERGGTLVLTPAEQHDTILGWICFERIMGHLIVHWVHARSHARGEGVGSSLLVAAGYQDGELVVSTQWSKAAGAWCGEVLERRGSRLMFDPFLMGRV